MKFNVFYKLAEGVEIPNEDNPLEFKDLSTALVYLSQNLPEIHCIGISVEEILVPTRPILCITEDLLAIRQDQLTI